MRPARCRQRAPSIGFQSSGSRAPMVFHADIGTGFGFVSSGLRLLTATAKPWFSVTADVVIVGRDQSLADDETRAESGALVIASRRGDDNDGLAHLLGKLLDALVVGLVGANGKDGDNKEQDRGARHVQAPAGMA